MWFKNLREDIKAAKRNDPAARNSFEILLTYSGVHALSWHRVAYFFHKIKFKLLARSISQFARFLTGIEIHPAAKIEGGVFIDHGSGVVIGETAEVHKGTVIYQGVTLGGTGKETGKRHPTIGDNVVVSSGAKILGSFTVGANSKIGSGSVVLHEVPPNSVVVGIPGRVVALDGVRVKDNDPESAIDLDHDILPDPVADYEEKLAKHMEEINKRLKELEKSIYTNCCQAKDKD